MDNETLNKMKQKKVFFMIFFIDIYFGSPFYDINDEMINLELFLLNNLRGAQ